MNDKEILKELDKVSNEIANGKCTWLKVSNMMDNIKQLLQAEEPEDCSVCNGLGIIGTSVGSNHTRGTDYQCDKCNGTGIKPEYTWICRGCDWYCMKQGNKPGDGKCPVHAVYNPDLPTTNWQPIKKEPTQEGA